MNNKDDSLQLYLKLDEIKDKKVIDISPKSQDSKVYGNPQVFDGELLEKCLNFDGENDYIEISNSDAINFGTHQDFTIETWIKVTSPQKFRKYGDNDIIEKWSQRSNRYPYVIRYLRDEQKLVAARYDGSNNPKVISRSKLTNNEFYHVAFVKKGNKLYLYLNGKEENSADDTTKNDTKNNSDLYLARRGSNKYANFFAGKIAYLQIYNRALSPQEIKQDMALSIVPGLERELAELRSLKAAWEQVKQGIGDLNSADRPDIPEDIKNILGILGQADITRQILLMSAKADQDRNQANEAKIQALQFAKKAEESAKQASSLFPNSLEAQKAQNAANQANNAAVQAESEFEKAEAAARNIKDLINEIVNSNMNSNSETSEGIGQPSLDEQLIEEDFEPVSGEQVSPETDQDLDLEREDIQQKAQEYADTAQTAKNEAFKQRDIAREKAEAAAQQAKKAGEYYDNWETIEDIFGFSEATTDGNIVDIIDSTDPNNPQDIPTEYDNWQVVGNLFGLPVKQENSEATKK